MCQLHCKMRCPVLGSIIHSGGICKGIPEEISIGISRESQEISPSPLWEGIVLSCGRPDGTRATAPPFSLAMNTGASGS